MTMTTDEPRSTGFCCPPIGFPTGEDLVVTVALCIASIFGLNVFERSIF